LLVITAEKLCRREFICGELLKNSWHFTLSPSLQKKVRSIFKPRPSNHREEDFESAQKNGANLRAVN